MATVPAPPYCGPVLDPGGEPRPLPWSERRYNDYTSRVVVAALSRSVLYGTAEALARPGISGEQYGATFAPQMTVQQLMVPSAVSITRAR